MDCDGVDGRESSETVDDTRVECDSVDGLYRLGVVGNETVDVRRIYK